jgi:hypothetical protein
VIAQQARAAVAGAAALFVLAGLWFGLAEAGTQRPSVALGGAEHPDGAEALTVLSPPGDLDEAHAAAEAFAVALYSDDLDGLREVSTEGLAGRLLGGRHGSRSGSATMRIDGVTTQDAQPDRVLAKVAVRRTSPMGERLEVVTVAVVRAVGRWLVEDAAF